MEQPYSSAYFRRQLIFFSLVAFVALLSLRFFILPFFYGEAIPNSQTIIYSLLEGFIVALVSSVALTLLLVYLFPAAKEQDEIKVVSPGKELKNYLSNDLDGTHEFWYRGHTAKWTRSVTLPKLASDAREKRLSLNAYMIILDPSNVAACKHLAFLDHQRDRMLELDAQVKYIQKQLLATILTVVNIKEEPLLKITLGLHKNFSLFRIDLSSKSAIITRSSPKEPALRYSATSDFYKSFLEELRVSLDQATIVNLTTAHCSNLEKLTPEAARALFENMGISVSYMDEGEMAEVIDIAQKAKSPY